MRGKLSILLSAALLLSALTACRSGTAPVDGSGSSQPPGGGTASYLGPDFTGSGPEDASGQPLPEAEPPVEYDPNYTLDISIPRVSHGSLELPVQGATGYASVQLPLWEEIPEVPEEEAEEGSEEDPESQPGDESGSGSGSSSQPGDASQPGDSSQPGDASQTGDSSQSGDTSQTGDSSQSGDVSQIGDASQSGSSALPGDAFDWEEGASSSNGLTPAPSSPFLPDFSQDEDISDPSQPTVGPDGELIYAPGEEPIPEVEEDPDVDPFEGALAVLEPGTAFLIAEESEEGDWWWVECTQGEGWIENRYCLINLPDVIPSMVYNATNSYDSRFVTLGRNIPNVTGRAFYPRGNYNRRLERNEFMMPVLYPMSKQICQAQQVALAQGNTLVLYEGYRPHEVQTTVYKALTALSRSNPEVKEAVTGAPWNISWFIAGGYSNHQRGFAIDVTLAKVERAELQNIGGHQVVRVREYKEYTMPTPIHELSKASATFVGPVASHSPTAWKSAQLTDTMSSNKPAMALQRCCTEAGLTPLASEWWHFNDLETRNSVLDNLSTGGYKISQCLSRAP